MAFNKRWSVPCLLLAALALLASGAAASEEVVSSKTTTGLQYDNYVYTISANLPKDRTPVSLTLMQPYVTGGGLKLVGWADNSAKGEYAFTYLVDSAVITDSTLAIASAIPADGVVTMRNTQATSTVQTPVFDFSAMYFTNNLTMELRNTFVDYSGTGVDTVVVQAGGSTAPALLSDHTSLQLIGMHTTGGSCLLRLAGAASQQATAAVSDFSLVGVDVVNAAGLSQAALCVDGSLQVTTNSVVRVTQGDLTSATVGGVLRKPQLAIDIAGGDVTVSSGSMFVVRDVSITDGGVIGSTSGDIMTSSVDGSSILSVLEVEAAEFCPSCSVDGFPASLSDDSFVYAQDWTIGGSITTDYADQGLGGAVGLTNMRDSDGKCRAAFCLPAGSNAIDGSAAECVCNCKPDGYYTNMCLGKPDPAATYKTCSDAHCLMCPTTVNVCTRCHPNYKVGENGECVVETCLATNCLTCADKDANTCETCAKGYGLNNGVCEKCRVPYCSDCASDPATCTQCLNGFELSSAKDECTVPDTECKVQNCAACTSADTFKCATCADGYALLTNGQCVRCTDPNCRTCDADVGKCTGCSSGYTLTDYGTCSPGKKCMVDKCAYCKVGNVGSCSQCIGGYDLNTADGTCVSSGTCVVSRCTKCAMGKPNFCQTCEEHYAPDNKGQCVAVPDPNCKVASCHFCLPDHPTVCQECMSGYAVTNTGKCSVQGWCKVAYCTTCESGNPNRCKTCFSNFKKQSDGTCAPPPLGVSAQAPPRALLFAAAAMLATALLGLV